MFSLEPWVKSSTKGTKIKIKTGAKNDIYPPKYKDKNTVIGGIYAKTYLK
jgi:hypothetical protein